MGQLLSMDLNNQLEPVVGDTEEHFSFDTSAVQDPRFLQQMGIDIV
jgi:hypothetical protein